MRYLPVVSKLKLNKKRKAVAEDDDERGHEPEAGEGHRPHGDDGGEDVRPAEQERDGIHAGASGDGLRTAAW